MKNSFISILLILVVFIGAISFNYFNFYDTSTESESTNKHDIKELISLRNKYQTEYDLLENEWFLRNLKENGKYCDKQYNNLYSTFEEFQRHKTIKDSIEILNVMINNYKF